MRIQDLPVLTEKQPGAEYATIIILHVMLENFSTWRGVSQTVPRANFDGIALVGFVCGQPHHIVIEEGHKVLRGRWTRRCWEDHELKFFPGVVAAYFVLTAKTFSKDV